MHLTAKYHHWQIKLAVGKDKKCFWTFCKRQKRQEMFSRVHKWLPQPTSPIIPITPLINLEICQTNWNVLGKLTLNIIFSGQVSRSWEVMAKVEQNSKVTLYINPNIGTIAYILVFWLYLRVTICVECHISANNSSVKSQALSFMIPAWIRIDRRDII